MSITYQLQVIYDETAEIATWNFNNEGAQKRCKVEAGDRIRFSFKGPGEVGECVLLCGQMRDGLASSPFVEGNRIDLKKQSTLTVAEQAGLWGFSIAFTVHNANARTAFRYVPDPEVDVGSRPGV